MKHARFDAGLDLAEMTLQASPAIHTQRGRVGTFGRVTIEWMDGQPFLVHEHGPPYPDAPRDRHLLSAFLRLADKGSEPEAVRLFAERHGLLGFCRHIRDDFWPTAPYQFFWQCDDCMESFDAHHLSEHDRSLPSLDCLCPLRDEVLVCPNCRTFEQREPVDAWLRLAKAMRGALSVVACLRAERQVQKADVVDLLGGDEQLAEGLLSFDRALPRTSLLVAVRDLMNNLLDSRGYGVSVYLDVGGWWPRTEGGRGFHFPRGLTVTGDGLLAALALEFAGAISSLEGVYMCDECGIPFTPTRRAPWKNGQRRTYCPSCRSDPGRKARAQRERYWAADRPRQRKSRYTSEDLGGHDSTVD